MKLADKISSYRKGRKKKGRRCAPYKDQISMKKLYYAKVVYLMCVKHIVSFLLLTVKKYIFLYERQKFRSIVEKTQRNAGITLSG
ncbi:MAG: hypothetical protein DRI69_02160 [Bacteroidetes bacterium]|nr:MAG: hypothetical protein DRI69_02160 [Bacteroidota bacterium]